MNGGGCSLTMAGQGTQTLDRHTDEIRPSTSHDLLQATRLADSLDEIGIYWDIVEASDRGDSMADFVAHMTSICRNFSKHIQEPTATAEQAPWLMEILQVVFGDLETIRRRHPYSVVLCPQSPLMIDEQYTDAYLALAGNNIPVVVMPMALMGATAPASLMGTVLVGNCEILATLCLLQAAEPGVPVIYAPVSAQMDPRTGILCGGHSGRGLIAAASCEMARHYGLPAMIHAMSTNCHAPGIQGGYERGMNTLTAMLSRPDLMDGAGLLGGGMILSLEQMYIDAEIFRRGQQVQQGLHGGAAGLLADTVKAVGPGGHFIEEPSTLAALRSEEWAMSDLGVHCSLEEWQASNRPTLLEEARAKVEHILEIHRPMPLEEAARRELDRIVGSARAKS
jgi:trimethylamine--corrinoid protein Co-methyltransferase